MIWRWIVGHKGAYKVSNTGLIKAVKRKVRNRYGFCYKRERILKPCPTKRGHLMVNLSKNSKLKGHYVHRLVLEAFAGKCPTGHECRHFPDQNPANNNLWNLSWASKSTNQRDRIANGTESRGEQHPCAILTYENAIEIRELYSSGIWSMGKLARMYKVSNWSIWQVVRFKTWI